MQGAHAVLKRRGAFTAIHKDIFTFCLRSFANAAPDAAGGSGPSTAGAVAALRERLQAGPELGDFINGTDLSSYSVYAPKPRVWLAFDPFVHLAALYHFLITK